MAYKLETLIVEYRRYTEAERWKELDHNHPLFLAMKELENIFIVNGWILRRAFVRAFIAYPSELLETDGIYVASDLSNPIPVPWNPALEPARTLLQNNLIPAVFERLATSTIAPELFHIREFPIVGQETMGVFVSTGCFQKGGQRFLTPGATVINAIIKPKNFVELVTTL